MDLLIEEALKKHKKEHMSVSGSTLRNFFRNEKIINVVDNGSYILLVMSSGTMVQISSVYVYGKAATKKTLKNCLVDLKAKYESYVAIQSALNEIEGKPIEDSNPRVTSAIETM